MPSDIIRKKIEKSTVGKKTLIFSKEIINVSQKRLKNFHVGKIFVGALPGVSLSPMAFQKDF